ncbi:MAG: helix-turn-helix domain-containing protein [Clostridia bacterium]|jgi:transcriptional regulator with XRE-family HTH domain|nr:helix-turn-helix domain-containing protein [Clostridia bacterium]
MEIFGIRVKQELKIQGKMQKNLCEDLNVSKSTMSEWLSNTNQPPLEMVVAIAKYLGVSTDYLLGLED